MECSGRDLVKTETGEDDESRFAEKDEGMAESEVEVWISKISGAKDKHDAKKIYTEAVVVCNAANDLEARARIKEALMTWA